METSVFDFRTSFYILAIQNITLYFPHVCILGTHHCYQEEFKHCASFQDLLRHCDHTERLIAISAHQIQS